MDVPAFPDWPRDDSEDAIVSQSQKDQKAAFNYLNKALNEAIELYTDGAIQELAKEVLGEDFWVAIKEAKRLRHGQVQGLPALNECLSKLVGCYVPSVTTAAMLHARREEEEAMSFLKAKENGYTDGTANQYARLHTGKIRMQEKAFEGLADGIRESIQVVKRLQDAELAELHMLPRAAF